MPFVVLWLQTIWLDHRTRNGFCTRVNHPDQSDRVRRLGKHQKMTSTSSPKTRSAKLMTRGLRFTFGF